MRLRESPIRAPGVMQRLEITQLVSEGRKAATVFLHRRRRAELLAQQPFRMHQIDQHLGLLFQRWQTPQVVLDGQVLPRMPVSVEMIEERNPQHGLGVLRGRASKGSGKASNDMAMRRLRRPLRINATVAGRVLLVIPWTEFVH